MSVRISSIKKKTKDKIQIPMKREIKFSFERSNAKKGDCHLIE